MVETSLEIDSNSRFEKPKGDMSKTRYLLVGFTSEWIVETIFTKFYMLKRYQERVSISQSLNKDDQATKRRLLQKRYELIKTDKRPKEEIKSKGLYKWN